MKKIFAILLSVLLLTSVITSCAGDPVVDDGNNGDVVIDNENDGTDPSDGTDEPDEVEEEPVEIVIKHEDEVIPEDVVPEKVLKFTISSTANTVSKTVPFTTETFSIPAGTTLVYDVYIENDVVGLGSFDIKFGGGSYLSSDNSGTALDNANIGIGIAECDITDYALGKWYRREIPLYDGGLESREVCGIRLGTKGLVNGCSYVCYYDNISFVGPDGNIIKTFTDEEIAALPINNFGGIECSFEVVDDPYPRVPRKTSEKFHGSVRKSAGKVSDGAFVDIVIDMDNTFEANGIYFGAADSSYIEEVNSYVVYKYAGALMLYHVDDDVSLASSVRVVNLVDDLNLRCAVEGGNLNVYAIDNTENSVPKLLWSVPTDVQAGEDFGRISVSGLGYVISGNDYEAEDAEAVGAITVYDAKTMPLVYMNCSTDKNPVEYRVGENMVFEIYANFNGEVIACPNFLWRLEGDDGETASGLVNATAGVVKLITKSDVPGFEYLEIDPADKSGEDIDNSYYLTGGAGADIHEMDVTVEKPADFEAFWQGKLDELEGIEPVLLESVQVDNEEYNIYYVKVEAGKYGPVTGKVAYPKNAEPGTLKLKLNFMGYGVADAGLILEPGYLTFGVNSHSIENGMDSGYYNKLASNELKNYGFNNEENSDRETVYFLQMLMRDVQAVRYLMQSEYWNGVDVELEGGSQGGFQCLAVGGLMNEYVTKVTAWAPAFCDWAGSTQGRLPSIFPFPDYLDPLSYYDTINFATMIKAPVSILTGLGDVVCRPSGISLLYDTITTPKDITWVQNMTHGVQFEYCLTYQYSEN